MKYFKASDKLPVQGRKIIILIHEKYEIGEFTLGEELGSDFFSFGDDCYIYRSYKDFKAVEWTYLPLKDLHNSLVKHRMQEALQLVTAQLSDLGHDNLSTIHFRLSCLQKMLNEVHDEIL